MTETAKIILKLAVLLIPGIILFATLYMGSKGDGIGGGGYDLSELVYSGLFTLFVICWNVWIIFALLTAKTSKASMNNKVLLVIGIVILIATATWFLRQLR